MSLSLILLFFSACGDQEIAPDIKNHEVNFRGEQSELQMIPCDPCLDGILTPVSKIYVINGCSITVSYIIEVCQNGRMAVRDFDYTIGSGAACYNLKQTWNVYYPSTLTLDANIAINAFYRQLTLLVQQDIIDSLNPNDYPSGYTDLQWIETKCHTLCSKQVVGEPGEPILYWDLSYGVCGNSCCIRNTTYIVVNNVFEEQSSEIIYSDGFCDPVTVRCKNGASQWNNRCEVACERL